MTAAGPGEARDAALPPQGPEPRGVPAAVGILLAVGVALLAVAAVCVRELLIHHGVVGGEPWLADASRWIARITWRTWMYYAAPAAVVAGVAVLVAALRPRRRTHVRTRGTVPLWLSPTAVARACSARATGVHAVESARTTATRRTVRVTVTVPERPWDPPPGDAALRELVTEAVRPLAERLDPAPRVAVRIVRILPTGQRHGSGRVG